MPNALPARYSNAGGALVEVRPQSPDRYIWNCRGCGTQGGADRWGNPYFPHELDKANQAAAGHAAACSALPPA